MKGHGETIENKIESCEWKKLKYMLKAALSIKNIHSIKYRKIKEETSLKYF